MTSPVVIDTRMHGRPGITACFLIEGERRALIETGPKSSSEVVAARLLVLGVDEIDWIVVTHIHLDHAGAAGTLARQFPEAKVAVHHVGAPHLVDPSKLWSSAARIYGDEMDKLWGGMDPIPEDRILALHDGDTIDLGGRLLTAVDTPGHAGHHHAYLDDATGTCFAGDALGVRLQEAGLVRPATPPPEFNLEDAIKSIERIRGLGASSLTLTHFGRTDTGTQALDVDAACDEAIESLREWETLVRAAREQSRDLDEVTMLVQAAARESIETRASPESVDRLEQTTSYRMNVAGYMRYLDKAENTG
jgi:glyoxylase-like metal-dependent hydrolase (beta-lactamase superfamily II)